MTIEKSKNPEEFKEFEHSGWDATITAYEDAFGLVTRQSVGAMLDAAKVRPGMTLLDVCTGPGMLAEAAIARGAKAIGLDLPQRVVELARKKVPTGEFRQGDAQNLPFADNCFDAVVCGYGIMHIPDPERAMREMMRVVRPRGRVALSVWHSETPTSCFSLIQGAVRAHGRLDVPLPHGPDFFQFGTEAKMRAALSEIGLVEVETRLFEQFWRVRSAKEVIDSIGGGTVRARALLKAQSGEAMIEIQRYIADTLKTLGAEGDYRVPMPAVVGSGSKPTAV